MYERILVPIDGGATAAQGLKEAVKIAKSHGSRIRLIHIVDDLPAVAPLGGGGLVIARLHDCAAHLLDSNVELLKNSGIPVDGELIEQIGGRPSDSILRAAEAFRADLIVCGTHGRTGLRRVALGSTAEEIVRRSKAPVLLVPPGAVAATSEPATSHTATSLATS